MGTDISTSVGMTMFGHEKVSAAPRLVRLLDAGPFIRQKFKAGAIAAPVSALANRLLKLRYPLSAATPGDYTVTEAQQFDSRFDSLWNRVKEDYPIMACRKSEYLSWRYNDPEKRYHTFCVTKTESGEIVGYIVTGVFTRSGITRAIIADLVSPRDAEEWLPQTLIGSALRFLREQSVSAVECWMFPHTHLYPHLRRYGFEPRRAIPMDLTFRYFGGDDPVLSDSDFFSNVRNWYLTAGDTDWA
jgi:hypothetical protein